MYPNRFFLIYPISLRAGSGSSIGLGSKPSPLIYGVLTLEKQISQSQDRARKDLLFVLLTVSLIPVQLSKLERKQFQPF